MLNRLFQPLYKKQLIIITVYDLDIQEISSVMAEVLLACKCLVGKPEWKGSFAKERQTKSQNHNSPQDINYDDIITFIWSSCGFCIPCNERRGSTKVESFFYYFVTRSFSRMLEFFTVTP